LIGGGVRFGRSLTLPLLIFQVVFFINPRNPTKKEGTSLEQPAEFFAALSDETRLRIVMLLTYGELCVCDLMAVLDEPQSKVSRHLACLRHCGITRSRRVGVWMHYSLGNNADGMIKAQVDLMKEHLARVAPYRRDMEKLRSLKREGCCRALQEIPGRRKA
jgi:ArsR family transcriptional regulator